MILKGRGKYSARERRVPLNPKVCGEILPFVRGKRSDDPMWPGTYSAIDHDCRRLLRRAEVTRRGRYSMRRGFGRISHDAGVRIESIQAMYRHESPGPPRSTSASKRSGW